MLRVCTRSVARYVQYSLAWRHYRCQSTRLRCESRYHSDTQVLARSARIFCETDLVLHIANITKEDTASRLTSEMCSEWQKGSFSGCFKGLDWRCWLLGWQRVLRLIGCNHMKRSKVAYHLLWHWFVRLDIWSLLEVTDMCKVNECAIDKEMDFTKYVKEGQEYTQADQTTTLKVSWGQPEAESGGDKMG